MTKYADAPKPVQEYYHKKEIGEKILESRRLLYQELFVAGSDHLRDEQGYVDHTRLADADVRKKVLEAKTQVLYNAAKREFNFDAEKFKYDNGTSGKTDAINYLTRIYTGKSVERLNKILSDLAALPTRMYTDDEVNRRVLSDREYGTHDIRLSENLKAVSANHIKDEHVQPIYDYLNKGRTLDEVIDGKLLDKRNIIELLNVKYEWDKIGQSFTPASIKAHYIEMAKRHGSNIPPFIKKEAVQHLDTPEEMKPPAIAEYQALERKINDGEISPEELLESTGKTREIFENLMQNPDFVKRHDPALKEAAQKKKAESDRRHEGEWLQRLDHAFNQGQVNEDNIMQIAAQNQIPPNIVSKFLAYKLKQAKLQPPQPTPPQPEPPEPQPRREHEPRPPEPTPGPEPTPQPAP